MASSKPFLAIALLLLVALLMVAEAQPALKIGISMDACVLGQLI
jgi:hypothetical protein